MHCPASFSPIFSIFIVSSDIPGSEGNRGNSVPVTGPACTGYRGNRCDCLFFNAAFVIEVLLIYRKLSSTGTLLAERPLTYSTH